MKSMSNIIKDKMRTVLSETKDLMSMRPILKKHGLLKIDFTYEPVCMFTFKVKGSPDTLFITNIRNIIIENDNTVDDDCIIVGEYVCGII